MADNSIVDTQWESVLAELQEHGQGNEVKGLDRLASLDLVSDLLSSEGFEGFSNPGPEERKLTRLASLELLTELFEGEGTLPECGMEPPSGVSNDWTDEDLLEALGVNEGEDMSGGGVHTPEQWGSFEPLQPEVGALNEESTAFQGSQDTCQVQQAQGYPVAWNAAYRQAGGVVPPFPLQNGFSASFDQGSVQAEDAPPQNPRIRFSARQQKALYRFGAKVNWVAPGLENLRDAHKLCADIGIGIRQLKKWISNHRPKELRLPVTHPPWCTAPTRHGSGPPLSQAAIASLAAAQAAVLGQPFGGPSTPSTPFCAPQMQPSFQENERLAAPNVAQMQPPFQENERLAAPNVAQMQPAFQGNERLAAPNVAQMQPPFQEDGRLDFAGGSGSSIGSMGSQNEGEGWAHPSETQSPSDSMKKVLRRKLKDFEPGKVQKLFQLCVEYRQKRRDRVELGGDLLKALESPRKKQRTDVFSSGDAFSSHLDPPLTPTRAAPKLKKLSSESGDDSEVTDNEAPPPEEPLASVGSLEAGWETEGNQLRPLPSFPSIDLSQFGFEQLSPAVDDTQAEVNRAGAHLHRALSISKPPLLRLPSNSLNPLTNPLFGPPHVASVGPPNLPFNQQPIPPMGLPNPLLNQQPIASLGLPIPQFNLPAVPAMGLPNPPFSPQLNPPPMFPLGLPNPPFNPPFLPPIPTLGLPILPPNLPPRPSLSLPNPPFNPLGTVKRPPSRSGREKSLPPSDWPQQLPGRSFLFEKVLTASDTSPLGRIIIPKVHAEAHLPTMLGRESCTLVLSDAVGRSWELRYRFWFNNKSRIYVLEHAADLILSRGLLPGDSIAFYRADSNGSLVMMDRKDQPSANQGAIGGLPALQPGMETAGKAPKEQPLGF